MMKSQQLSENYKVSIYDDGSMQLFGPTVDVHISKIATMDLSNLLNSRFNTTDKLVRALARVAIQRMFDMQRGVTYDLPSVDVLVAEAMVEVQRVTVDQLIVRANGDWEVELSDGMKASGKHDSEGFHHDGAVFKFAKDIEAHFGGLTPQ